MSGRSSLLLRFVLLHSVTQRMIEPMQAGEYMSHLNTGNLDPFISMNLQLRGFGTKRSRRKKASEYFVSMFNLNSTAGSVFRAPLRVYKPNKEHPKREESLQTDDQNEHSKKGKYLLVLDASNVMHHGGDGLDVGNLLGFLHFLRDDFHCKEEDILVIIDFWVARKLGNNTLDNIRSFHKYTRVTRPGVAADVRIMQTAYAVKACIVSNDMFFDYCPFQVESSRMGSKTVHFNSSSHSVPTLP
uniref:RNase NYN domain-containing protein n=1 Tax=Guillardia theta TaxID=55529 RepID=A0A7S4PQ32_GUITH|mmetsp:Transcript_9145/g.30488  ORF Transcript_9145/g.30488 Transcript_9145/m.30488 type:complete len:243 (+) Transcript_9145:169-897(+)